MGAKANEFYQNFNGIEDFVGGKGFFELEAWFGELKLEEWLYYRRMLNGGTMQFFNGSMMKSSNKIRLWF
jgi:hypothetical protein